MTPAGLRKAARGSAGTRKLVGIATCKQSLYGYDVDVDDDMVRMIVIMMMLLMMTMIKMMMTMIKIMMMIPGQSSSSVPSSQSGRPLHLIKTIFGCANRDHCNSLTDSYSH